MGVIAKQSGFAAIALGAGMVIGALNNMVVLPRAFDGNEAIWGLVRIMTSWGMICASISTLGAPGSIVRFLHRYEEGEREKLEFHPGHWRFGVLTTLAISEMGRTLDCVARSGQGRAAGAKRSLVPGDCRHYERFAHLSGPAHVEARTAFIAWVDELWQKTSYFVLGALLLLIGFRSMHLFPCTSHRTACHFSCDGRGKYWPVQRSFEGIQSERSAAIRRIQRVQFVLWQCRDCGDQLDYIMVGKFLGLEEVRYTPSDSLWVP